MLRSASFLLLLLLSPLGPQVFAEEPTIEALVARLRHAGALESAEAAKSLGELGAASPLALNALVAALADDRIADDLPFGIPAPRETVASSAADALLAIGKPAVHHLAEAAVESGNEEVQYLALKTLRRLGHEAAASAPRVEDVLDNENQGTRYHAVWTLAAIEGDESRLVETLRPILADESPHVRSAAIESLGNLGESAASAAAEITRLLEDPEHRWHAYSADMIGMRPVRYDAAMALARMGKAARPELPKLRIMMTGDDDALVRVSAAYAVAQLGADRDSALAVLSQFLDSRERNTEPIVEAAMALRRLGPKARSALPAITRALGHPDDLVRVEAARATASVAPENAKELLLPMLSDSDGMVRSAAVESLGDLGLSSDDVVAAFVEALDDHQDVFSADVRHAAATALGKIGPEASEALPKLRQLVATDERQWVRDAAAEAIQAIVEHR